MNISLRSVFFVFCFVPLSAFAQDPNVFFDRQAPPQVSSLDDEYLNVLTMLADGQVSEAQQALEKIKKDAKAQDNKEMQSKAQATLRRSWDLYGPVFREVDNARKALQSDQPKVAQDAFEQALKIAGKQKPSDIPELQAIDRGLGSYLENYSKAANERRITYLQERIEAGRGQLQYRDYQGAIEILEAAQKQTYPERGEAEALGLTALLDQAQYGRLFNDAGRLAQEGKYPEALDNYQQALEKNDNPEVRRQIDITKSQYQTNLLDEAETAIQQEKHDQALKTIAQASELGPSPRIQEIKSNTYTQFRQKGDQLAGTSDYKGALEAYKTALKYQDDPTLREQITVAENKLAHDQNIQKATAYIEKGNLSSARKYLEKATQYDQSKYVRDEIVRIDNYYQHLNAGKGLLKEKPVDAYHEFREAQKIYDVKEVQKLIDKAQKKAGPALSPLEASDFYQD